MPKENKYFLIWSGLIVSVLLVIWFWPIQVAKLQPVKESLNQSTKQLGAGQAVVELPAGDKATAAQLDNILKTRKLSNSKGVGETDILFGLVNKKKALNGGVINLTGCFKADKTPQIDQCLINYIK